jgi:hypothetical protein
MRSIFLYPLLVGTAIAGIIGLLRIGERLTAPVSIGGAWSLALDPTAASDQACRELSTGFNQRIMTVSQSGLYLRVTFDNPEPIVLAGEIHELLLTAASQVSDEIQVQARVDRQADPDRLLGTITSKQCHAPVAVTAARLDATRSAGGDP